MSTAVLVLSLLALVTVLVMVKVIARRAAQISLRPIAYMSNISVSISATYHIIGIMYRLLLLRPIAYMSSISVSISATYHLLALCIVHWY